MMPSKPKRTCPTPGCPGTWDGTSCDVCGRQAEPHGWRYTGKQRGTRQERGYDQRWQKLRAQKLAQDPLCEDCLKEGLSTLATQVHHATPFRGLADPLRLAMTNLESLCRDCHQKKTEE